MRSEDEIREVGEIREMFAAMVKQRDNAPMGSASRTMLTQRIIGVAWVLKHKQVHSPMLSDEAYNLYNCLH
jgi:hypothetical protein